MNYKINNIPALKIRRRDLRSHLTPVEAKLWNYLKNNRLGVKFRRQHSIGYYIVDFYCPLKKLAIELDGSPHDTQQGYAKDLVRTEFLQTHGISIIRFQNKDVVSNLEGVLAEIIKHLN